MALDTFLKASSAEPSSDCFYIFWILSMPAKCILWWPLQHTCMFSSLQRPTHRSRVLYTLMKSSSVQWFHNWYRAKSSDDETTTKRCIFVSWPGAYQHILKVLPRMWTAGSLLWLTKQGHRLIDLPLWAHGHFPLWKNKHLNTVYSQTSLFEIWCHLLCFKLYKEALVQQICFFPEFLFIFMYICFKKYV